MYIYQTNLFDSQKNITHWVAGEKLLFLFFTWERNFDPKGLSDLCKPRTEEWEDKNSNLGLCLQSYKSWD